MARTYIRLHDSSPEHPKIEALSAEAFRVWIKCLCWCSRGRTDGHIPANSWPKRGHYKYRNELVRAGLVDVVDDGVVMHDYLEWQRSSEQILAIEEQRREAGKASANRRTNRQRAVERTVEQNVNAPTIYTETETEKNLIRPGSGDPRPDVEKICEHLADRIVDNGSKRPTITARWRTDARLLIDKDDVSVERIIRAIDWCQSDVFWRANILSMPKLRAKYDQIRLAAQREQERAFTLPASTAPVKLDPADACEEHPWLSAKSCSACRVDRLAVKP